MISYLYDRLNSYKLKLREKLRANCSRQLARALRMLIFHPPSCCKQGFLKITLALTYRCQCSCQHCCAGRQPRLADKEMSLQEWRRLIEQAARFPSLGTLVSFFGGEALMRPEIFELIAYAASYGLFTEIETNGLLLDEIAAKNLKKCGLSHVFIRLEGASAQTHDRLSGYPCYEAALQAARNCRKYGLSFSISTVAIKNKIYNRELAQIIAIAKSLGVSSVRILYPALAGNWIHETSQVLSAEEEQMVRKYLEPGFVYLESTDTSTNGSKRVCPTLKKKSFYISPYGQVWPCSFVQHNFGDLHSQELSDIVRSMWADRLLNSSSAGCMANDPRIRQCGGN